MKNISNISSEEELLQLREEGKISEAEYEELREALEKSSKATGQVAPEHGPAMTRTCGLAIASLVCSLLGPLFCLPAIICGHVALRKIERDPELTGHGLALAGLIIGYLGLAFSMVLVLLFGIYAERGVVPGEAVVIAQQMTDLRRFPLDSMEGVLTQSGVTFDEQISADGNGSLRIDASEPTTIRLFETGDIDIESARLIYHTHVRTENLDGQAYLEMWCHFPGKGEFFSRGLMDPLSGTTNWTTLETSFLLKKGENPDNVKLNLVINGKGTAWIDDVRLLKGKPI
jgi:hypothetical protein